MTVPVTAIESLTANMKGCHVVLKDDHDAATLPAVSAVEGGPASTGIYTDCPIMTLET